MKSIEMLNKEIDLIVSMLDKLETFSDPSHSFSIHRTKVDTSSINDFDLFPIEYQQFVSRVGYVDIHPGYFGLHIGKPILINMISEINDDYCLHSCEIAHWKDDHSADSQEKWWDGIFKSDSKTYLVASLPCSYNYFFYMTHAQPYQPFEWDPQSNKSFLSFVLDFIKGISEMKQVET